MIARHHLDRIVAALWSAVLACLALQAAQAAPEKPAVNPANEYEALIEGGKTDAVAERTLRAYAGPRADGEIEALGRLLAVSGERAALVFDALSKSSDPRAVDVTAELLTWAARVEEKKAKPMPTPELARRASVLLTHEDPFVRALAEWAISIRVGTDYESTETPWPETEDWYRDWLAVEARDLADFDYARQIISLGRHRTAQGLLSAAGDSVRRARELAAHVGTHPKSVSLEMEPALEQLASAQAKLGDLAASGSELTTLRRAALDVRLAARAVVFQNPDLAFEQILFATRKQRTSSGNITSGHYPSSFGPGGDIVLKTGLQPESPARALLDGRLGPGSLRGLDLWWDADRMVFSFLRQPEGRHSYEEWTHLYEMRIDGTELRQLTNASYNSDIEPCYLPNGDIVFSSDRSNMGSQCAGSPLQDNMVMNLWRCDANGKNCRPLSNNKEWDRYPHVMDNGQILFLHWEYQERHWWHPHVLWTCRPDGSMADALYKQHILGGPFSLREARHIPGTSKLAAIACGHHNRAQGAVMLTDYSTGINNPDGMRMVTPGVSYTEGGYGPGTSWGKDDFERGTPVEEGGVPDAGGHYQYPYPLSEKSFLAAYSYKRPERFAGLNFGLYYIDVWGNKELIHRDRLLSVAFLIPVKKQQRPPVLPDLEAPVAEDGKRYATLFVNNVYDGLDGVKPGTVKYLRISQKTPWPCIRTPEKECGFNDLHYSPDGGGIRVFGVWDWSPARSIGVVPVEEDGSAHFVVPADQQVYFQALDESFLEVRRMRSNVNFQHGEYRGCTGCHESRGEAAGQILAKTTLATNRPPSTPLPPSWGAAVVPGYQRHIQPILDRHCVECHGAKEPDGGLDFSGRIVDGFAQGYRTMFGLKPTDPTPVANNGWEAWQRVKNNQPPPSAAGHRALADMHANQRPGQLISIADKISDGAVSQPYEFGSSQSKLVTTLLSDPEHKESVRMERREWIDLLTWIDLNACYSDQFLDKDQYRETKRFRHVNVEFPDPWLRPPSGEWIWKDNATAALQEDR